MPENNIVAVKKFFDDKRKPMSSEEFTAFWQSLSDEEKAYYKSAELG